MKISRKMSNTAVITTKFVLFYKSDILFVYHYLDDNMWQFSGKEKCNDEDYRVVSLEEMIQLDNSINEILHMLPGYYAYRENKNEKWKVELIE